MKNKFYCVHAHFDVPFREDPWTEECGEEPGRLFRDCIGPNTAAALLDWPGSMAGVRNNFESLSFDFSPALLEWLERREPRAYAGLLEADRLSRARNGGHGSALASPCPSLILPLASEADKRAAIRWGLLDFERRFGRPAEGLWLPENAADEETLAAAAEAGVRFTLLSSAQAARVRRAGSRSEEEWAEAAPRTLAPTRPYLWRSQSRPALSLAVFCYRADLSPERLLGALPLTLSTVRDRARECSPDARPSAGTPPEQARERILESGERFANRLVDSLTANDAAELAHAALDGDWFGLRQPHGEWALAVALELLSRDAPARSVNYGRFLDLFPPPQEVELRRLSSRSCPHGVGRWSTDCGCGPEARWRAPLREALHWLSTEADRRFEGLGRKVFVSPAAAREDYGPLIRLPGPAAPFQAFLDLHAKRHPTPGEARLALRLCEMERWRLTMLARWGWEGSLLTDPGPVSALLAAARTMDLMALVEDDGALGSAVPRGGPAASEALRQGLLSRLARVPAAGTPYTDAAEAFVRLVQPSRLELRRGAAHYAVADHLRDLGLLDEDAGAGPARTLDFRSAALCRRGFASRRRERSLSVSRFSLRSLRTCESLDGCAAVLHCGGTDLRCWILPGADRARCEEIAAALDEALLRASAAAPEPGAAALDEALDRIFGRDHFTLDALFPAARRAAARRLLPRGDSRKRRALEEWDAFIARLRTAPAEVPSGELARLLAENAELGTVVDALPGAEVLRRHLRALAAALERAPEPARLSGLVSLLETAAGAGLHVDLWELRALGWRLASERTLAPLPREALSRLARLLGLPEPVLPPEAAAGTQEPELEEA